MLVVTPEFVSSPETFIVSSPEMICKMIENIYSKIITSPLGLTNRVIINIYFRGIPPCKELVVYNFSVMTPVRAKYGFFPDPSVNKDLPNIF